MHDHPAPGRVVALQQAHAHLHVVGGVQQDPDVIHRCRRPAEDPLQDLPVRPTAVQVGQGGHDVGGDLRPCPEVAVPGVHVGVGDVVGFGAAQTGW